MQPTLDTPRMQLRPLEKGDEALYRRLYTDPEVMRQIGPPLSAEAAGSAFATVVRLMRQDVPPLQAWVLRDRGCGADVGIIALIRRAGVPEAREIGTMLLAAGQGRGFAVEAQTALLDWLFTVKGVRIVGSSHAAGHGAVIGVKQALGFVRADRRAALAADVQDAGAQDQRVHWQMTRERWNAGGLARDGKA